MLILGLFGSNATFAIIFIVALLICLTVHEYAHALVATKLGDPTAKLDGRLTLNPIAHLDPMGTVFLLLVGFGWGKPVPINPRYFSKKSDEILVALAGITTNLILALACAIPLRSLLASNQAAGASTLIVFLSVMVLLDVILAVFNLLPIPPLDGSHVVEYFLSDSAKYQYQFLGPYLLIGLILLDYFSSTSIIFALAEPVIRFIAGSQITQLFFR
ncbi:site-2 protease family protein [Candidatus Berkelbacteria bacterium CG10_big_fil_rev_8_21_14_0_10_43_13]|uniref:Site-2 protease family protein n=1 Tax=Candidatus Berkelbacteria bacterium CG10_big_fil_rev_8_21_14_0_10_43_13 TaxID=1974514 RepID=A0A2H0W6Z9_9BACT|nr:MAG: site-2 protease family protein [Candidatus Berkelbacteria bacterium CG10_big_fil_rev_8_21_14_0_10_43_13]